MRKRPKVYWVLVPLVLSFCGIGVDKGGQDTQAQTMEDYCYIPPNTAQEVKPNVLFVVDFSGSMQFPAYVDCNFTHYSQQKVAQCREVTASYNSTRTYWGYFKPDKCYVYVKSGYFTESPCNCENGIGPDSGCLSGNVLNWATTTRIDAVRKVLTGGKTPQEFSQPTRFVSEGAEITINTRMGNSTYTFTITANKPDQRQLTIRDSSGRNVVDRANIQISLQSSEEVQGIIHQVCDTSDLNGQINEKCKVIMELMVFAGDGRNGEIRTGKTTTISSLISAINNEPPYAGAPTGEALWEAYDYYTQNNTHPYENNSDAIQKGNPTKDPYFDGRGQKAVPAWCRKAFVLLLSDGAWNGNVDPVVPAREMATSDLRPDLESTQSVYTYVVYAWGDDRTSRGGREGSITTAIFGGFEDYDSNKWPYPFTGVGNSCTGSCGDTYDNTCRSNVTTIDSSYCNSRAIPYPLSRCNVSGTWDDGCKEWDTAFGSPRDGLPYNFYEADDIESLRVALLSALYEMIRRASSSSAVACLTSRTGFSSLVIQPYYYPRYQSQKGERSWLGFLKAFWLDPKMSLREDTIANKILDLARQAFDKVIKFLSPSPGEETKIARLSGDEETEEGCKLESLLRLNEVSSVWDAGCLLAQRDLQRDPRKVYVNTGNGTSEFSPNNTQLISLLSSIWGIQISDETVCIMRYLLGEDVSSDPRCINFASIKRPRDLLGKELCGSGDQTIIWRLGDIITSTPSVISDQSVNIYHIKYGDESYRQFISSQTYRGRPTIAFVAANDGMLHAFRIGYPKMTGNAEGPVKLVNRPAEEGQDLVGREEWAFVPYNALPYLKWYGHKSYCHIPTVDYRTLVVDAKVQGQWKTLLIGAMGFGGKALGGFSSSVFVLDVTDPLDPKLLWERPLSDQTLTLSMPAVIKVGDRWFVVMGSGPKDPKGESFIGSPKIYFFAIEDGQTVKEIDLSQLSSNKVSYAAVGDLMPVDADNDYQDDAIYFGIYTKDSGNFYRLRLRKGTNYIDPSNLTKEDVSLAVDLTTFKNQGLPVFAAPAFAKGKGDDLWVYFGTGRFLSPEDKVVSYSNYLIGFIDSGWDYRYDTTPTYKKQQFTDTTNSSVTATALRYTNVCECSESSCKLRQVVTDTSPINPQVQVQGGWYFELPMEVIISQPSVLGKTVEAISYRPSNDICEYEGKSSLLSLYYLTGTANPRPVVLSPEATEPIGGNQIRVKPKILLGSGSPPLGNPFQVIGPGGRQYTKLVQISGVLLRIEQQVAEPLRGRVIQWAER